MDVAILMLPWNSPAAITFDPVVRWQHGNMYGTCTSLAQDIRQGLRQGRIMACQIDELTK
jgi:hypothetical protein